MDSTSNPDISAAIEESLLGGGQQEQEAIADPNTGTQEQATDGGNHSAQEDVSQGTDQQTNDSSSTEDQSESHSEWHKMTNGRFSSEEDYNNAIQRWDQYEQEREALLETRNTFEAKKDLLDRIEKDEMIKGLIEFVDNGGDPNMYYDLQRLSPENMKPKELLEKQFLLEHQNVKLPKERLKALFNKEFNDKYGEIEEGSDEETRLMLEADKARVQLSSYKREALKVEKPAPPTQEEIQAQIELIERETINAVANISTTTFKVGDKEGESFNFKLDEQAAKGLRESVSNLAKNPNTFWQRYFDKQGNMLWDKFAQDMSFLQNKDAIIREAFMQGTTNEKITTLENSKNPTQRKANDSEGTPSLPNNIEDAIERAIMSK